MEEEKFYCSLPDITDSILPQAQQDSWTSVDHRYINGEQEAIVWGETEMQINQSHGTDQLNLSPKAGRESPEEAEQWEQMIWPVRPMSCTSAPLSFATVQWDMPGPSEELPSLTTDSSLANELDCGGGMFLDATSPSLHQSEDIHTELFTPEEIEEQDGFVSEFTNSEVEWTGNGFEPCDTADVQELTTQEKEDSTCNLLQSKSEIPLRTDLKEEEEEEEEGHSVTSDPVETVDLNDTHEKSEGSDDEVDSFVDVKLEEELEELCVLLTGQGNSEEEQISANGVETEDENKEECEVEKEQSVTNVPCAEGSEEATTISYLSDVEVPVEPLQVDDTGFTINPDKLIDLQPEDPKESWHSGTEEDIEILEQLHEDPTGQIEDPEMCKDVEQNVDSEQSETDDNEEEILVEVVEHNQRINNSQEILELTEKDWTGVEETSYLEQQDCDQASSRDREPSPQPEYFEQLDTTRESEQIEAEVSHQTEEQHPEDSEQLRQSPHLDQSPQIELTEQLIQLENEEETKESIQPDEIVCVQAGEPEGAEPQEQLERPTEQNEQSLEATQQEEQTELSQMEKLAEPSNQTEEVGEEQTELNQMDKVAEPTNQTEEVGEEQTELSQMEKVAEPTNQTEEVGEPEDGDVQTVVANGEQSKPLETAAPLMNGGEEDGDKVRQLAERLFKLDGIQRVDVVKHLDKDNNFSHAVGEEYLKFFDFTGQTLDQALRSFLKVVILIGETQERERVLQHFACRFHQCNPDSFSSSGAVLALTCAVMLLNTDLHGQHVGKSMSSSKFVSNLDGMNEGKNFSKDLLKSLYNSIKSEPLEWAVDDDELKSSVLPEDDAGNDAPLRSKANPFLDVPHDKNASVVKQGSLQRKLHADIDGKRTPWGKRGWKIFNGVLRGMVLYLQKDDYRRDQLTNEEVVSVHHSLAEPAADYTKKPNVFRLQTADWRVFLFQATSKLEMHSWISRINLVSALHSSPPFPAAVGSQRKFFRPILPASQSAHTLERQLQSHAGMLESFKGDLSYLQQNPPEGKKARTKELEEHRIRAEYLQHEMSRYEIYVQVLEGWRKVVKSDELSPAELNLFDKTMCPDSVDGLEEEECNLKKSHSSPSLELEIAPPTVIKVKRNISERRTYRRTVVPRWNKEA